jgi:hypothetical protein
MEGYLYLRNNDVAKTSTFDSQGKWSKRFCSLVEDPKRGPFFVARKRMEEEYKNYNAIEKHIPFATSLVKLTNFSVKVEEDKSSGSEVGGIITLEHNTLDTVYLRDKNFNRAQKWEKKITNVLKNWESSPYSPSKDKKIKIDENTDVNINKKKGVVFDKTTISGKSTGGEYKATIMKHKSEKAVRSAAQETLAVGNATTDSSSSIEDNNDYKESLKAKAQSQVLLMDGKRRFLEEKKAAEEEARRRQQRVDEQETAQMEMSKLLAEAEKRQAEKQRLLTESQLQTEMLQRKALAAAKRAEDMISQNEKEVQNLLEEANRKKALAEQLRKEQAEEEHQAQIQAEMMRQLEEQRKERERLEREEAARKREQEEIAALKAALEKKLKGSTTGIGVKNKSLTIVMFLAFVVTTAWLAIGRSGGGVAMLLALQRRVKSGNDLTLNPIKKTFALDQMDDQLSLSIGDADAGFSVAEVLRTAPQDEVGAALSPPAETIEFEGRWARSRSEDSTGGVATVKRRNPFRSLVLVITSPMRLLSALLKRLFIR